MVGPNRPIDTNKYFVICSNVLGGCVGTTGPNDINPKTNKIYGPDFPTITIRDMVRVQKILIDELEYQSSYQLLVDLWVQCKFYNGQLHILNL